MRRPLAEMYLDLGEIHAARNVLLEAPATVPPIQWLTVCLYERKPVQAAELLSADPAPVGFIDADTAAYVLRDASLATGDLEEGRTELLDREARSTRIAPYVMMAVSHLSSVVGDREASERQARRLLEANYGFYGVNRRALTVPKAAALTLLGEHDAAIKLLQKDFRLGFRWRWWYAFDREPAFDPLRADPRFRALAARAHAHADAERERLSQMRDRGQVPSRASGNPSGPKGC